MNIQTSDDSDGFRECWIELDGTTWRFREMDGLQQELIADMALSDYRAGLAVVAATMRDLETGEPYFASIGQGIEYLLSRPAGLLRQVLQHGAQVVNRFQAAGADDPEL